MPKRVAVAAVTASALSALFAGACQLTPNASEDVTTRPMDGSKAWDGDGTITNSPDSGSANHGTSNVSLDGGGGLEASTSGPLATGDTDAGATLDAGQSTVPFKVVSTTPAPASLGADTDSVITVVFSAAVDMASVRDGSIRVIDETGTAVAVQPSISGATVTLTPASPLCLFTMYTVTVSAGVKSIVGTPLASDYPFQFRTEDGRWHEPVKVSEDLGEIPGGYAHVAADQQGNGVVVWHVPGPLTEPARSRVWASVFRVGQSWSSPQALSREGDGAAFVSVAMRDGVAWAIWRQVFNGRPAVFASQYQGGEWKQPARIGEPTSDLDAFSLDVAMPSGSEAIAVWQQKDVTSDVWSNRFANGQWATAQVLDRDDGPVFSPRISVNNRGGAIVSWRQYTDNDPDVWTRRFENGRWEAPVGLKLGVKWPAGIRDQSAALDDAGGAFALWSVSDNAKAPVVSLSQFASGVWQLPQVLRTASSVMANIPDVAAAAGPKDAFLAAWAESGNVWVAQKAAGAWRADSLGAGVNPWADPKVAVDGRGNGLAVWSAAGIDNATTINAARFIAGSGSLPRPEVLPIRGDSRVISPTIALGGRGNVIVAWLQNSPRADGSATNASLWVRRFE